MQPAFQSASPIPETAASRPAKSPQTRRLMMLLVLALFIPLLGYGLLPLLGVGGFAQAFDFKKQVLLFGGIVGGVGYFAYLRAIITRPQLLVAFTLLAWPLVDYGNNFLMAAGLNIHLRPLLLISIALPGFWLSLKHGRQLWQVIPWFKYYLCFFLILVIYFIFYNANAMDPTLGGGEDSVLEGSASVIQLTSYFYCLMAITVPAIAMLKIRDYRGLFDTLNKALLWVSGLEALATILGYPFGMFNMMLDGFTRAIGIFTHPNPFAHHMGILMVYLTGLFCYYQGIRRDRMPAWLLLTGLGLNFVAFLLGLSKTALSVFALCAGLIFLLNLAVPAVRRSFLNILLVLMILLPVAFFGFEALSGQSFFSLLESRIDQTQSLTWRTLIWQDLLADINGFSILWGHGLTAANETVFRLSFNDASNAKPLMMVHNAYIALLYDLGLFGYLMFVAAASLLWTATCSWFQAIKPALRTEHSILIALTCYFLCVCAFDEMSYMFDAPSLFWTLASLLYGLHWRERQTLLALRASNGHAS